jgi:hypothetical protein
MFSADQILGPAGHWHPHMMVFAPYYVNAMVGGNEDSHHLPAVGDDSGTPFAIITIPVDGALAVNSSAAWWRMDTVGNPWSGPWNIRRRAG